MSHNEAVVVSIHVDPHLSLSCEFESWLFCRKNPALSEQLAGVTKHFEEDRERFLMPLCE